MMRSQDDKIKVIYELQEEVFLLKEEKLEMAKAFDTLTLNEQRKVVQHIR